jgi:hypothetical protein
MFGRKCLYAEFSSKTRSTQKRQVADAQWMQGKAILIRAPCFPASLAGWAWGPEEPAR